MTSGTDDDLVRDALRDVLEPGERVAWLGRPPRGFMLRASDAIMIPFSVMWCGGITGWMWGVTTHAPFIFSLWGMPFVLVGLHLLIGRFIADAWIRGRTVYGVTNHRVLIVTRGWRRNVRSLGLEGLTEITLRDGASGRGSLIFGREERASRSYGALTHSFERIENAADVLRLIRNAQRALPA